MNIGTFTITRTHIGVCAALALLAFALLFPAGSVQAQTATNESRFSISELRSLLLDVTARLSALRTNSGVTNELPAVGQICTMDAKICPDGSSVGRTGPNCSFAACPGERIAPPCPLGATTCDGPDIRPTPPGDQNLGGYHLGDGFTNWKPPVDNGGVTNEKPCVFTRNLTVGATGEDVRCLQRMLNANSDTALRSTTGGPGKETTYFGVATANAVARFQEKFRSNILTPVGLSQGNGYFGVGTRSQILELLNSGGFTNWKPTSGQICTMDAKICPDGSSVGRTGPNCSFAACPGDTVSGKPSGITVPITPGEQNIPGGYYYSGPPLIGDGNSTPVGTPGSSN